MGITHKDVSGMIKLKTIDKILVTFKFMDLFASFEK